MGRLRIRRIRCRPGVVVVVGGWLFLGVCSRRRMGCMSHRLLLGWGLSMIEGVVGGLMVGGMGLLLGVGRMGRLCLVVGLRGCERVMFN